MSESVSSHDDFSEKIFFAYLNQNQDFVVQQKMKKQRHQTWLY